VSSAFIIWEIFNFITNQIFEIMRKLTIWLMGLFFITSLNLANAQTSVSGTVTSADDGSTLPGVSVVIQGTSLGTTTDMDGKYVLSVPDGSPALVFSFVGMEKQVIPFSGQSVINVVMQPSSLALDEVVVTAIGISREKKELGYNVQTVDADVIASKPNADVVNSLAGRTSGVQITSSAGDAGASTYITIRGAASITGNNEPLFVVNGMPIISGGGSSGVAGVNTSSRSIDLNPDDIESITVLKGGAATALYGVRAANGALVITTKSGKKLNARKIEFNTSVGFDKVSQLPARQTKYSQGLNGAWIGGYSASFGAPIADLEYDGDATYKWDPNGRLVAAGTGNGMPAQYYDPFEFFQTGVSTNNNLSISNGGENGSFFFSMSNLEQDGIIPNNHFGRTTLRLNSTTKLSDKITFGSDFAYTNSVATQIQKGSNVSGIMLGLLRTATTFDNSAGYEFADGTQRNYRNGGGYDNPYWVANKIAFNENINRFTGSGNLNIRFNDFLSLSYNAGIDWYNRRYTNQFAIGSRGNPAGYLDEYMNYSGIFNSDLLLNFQKDLTEKINLKATLGGNMYSSFGKYLYGDADGLEIADFYQLSNSATNTVSSGISNYRTMAVFADVHLSYDNMLYLGVTGRNDWSTTMPEANLSAFYPSVSLGFVFTELEALKDNSVLSYGKLRASVARTANIAGAYNTSNYFYGAGTGDGWTNGVNFPYQGYTGFSLGSGLGNPDLKHETMDSWEVGTDLRLFQNRLGLDISYFKNTNKDLLMSVPIAPSSGFSSVFLNAATMESQGVELSLDATVLKSGDFKWDLFANFTKMTNTVVSLAPGVDNLFLGGFTVPQVRAVAGQEYGSIFGNDWYKDADGNILINDDPTDNYRDGYPWTDSRSMVPIGNVNPDWTANITNTLTFKDITLSFMWDIKKGGMLYNGTAFAMNYFGVSARTETREVYYTPEGTIDFDKTPAENIVVFNGVYGHLDADGNPVGSGVTNTTPVVLDQDWYRGNGSNFGGGPSVAAMEHSDWVRLRDLTLSYNLPIKNTFIKHASIYFTGKNLLLFTPYTGIDPETNLAGATNGQGMDYFNNPGTKTYMFGLKVTL
jgi:TonB-linked SusC/RagA family outer membrane protein